MTFFVVKKHWTISSCLSLKAAATKSENTTSRCVFLFTYALPFLRLGSAFSRLNRPWRISSDMWPMPGWYLICITTEETQEELLTPFFDLVFLKQHKTPLYLLSCFESLHFIFSIVIMTSFAVELPETDKSLQQDKEDCSKWYCAQYIAVNKLWDSWHQAVIQQKIDSLGP